MRRIAAEPMPADTRFASFGAMFHRCGLIGTAAPDSGDTRRLHGELPLAATVM